MDLNSFKKVKTVNTGKSGDFPYDIRIESENRLYFTSQAFRALGLDNNSLSQYNDEEAKQIALVVKAGNSGDFARGIKNKQKGQRHKNDTLVNNLREFGIAGKYLSITEIGVVEGEKYFLISEYTGPVEEETSDVSAESEA
jgi:hypothetical protein